MSEAHPSSAAHDSIGPPIHQDPLAYLLGLAGVALMRAFAGEFDKEFTAARLADVRRLLDAADVLGPGIDLPAMTPSAAYDGWAAGYDTPDNGLFAIEEPVVRAILDRLPTGVAVDAACGTGRHAAYLAGRGHQVYGFDVSTQMLARARQKVPDAHFSEADLRSLPLRSSSVDLVVCALALAHVEALAPVFGEVARVLRPGGHFVVSDTRTHYVGSVRYPLVKRDLDGALGYLPGWWHETGAYLRAALAHGFVARECEEALRPQAMLVEASEAAPTLPAPGEPPDVWALMGWAPDAARATYANEPCLVVWDFELLSG